MNQGVPRIISPGPCRLPVLTRLGGLSTIEWKFELSAGECAHLLTVLGDPRNRGNALQSGHGRDLRSLKILACRKLMYDISTYFQSQSQIQDVKFEVS